MEVLVIITSLLLAAIVCVFSRRRSVIEVASIAASLLVCAASILTALKVASSGTYAPFTLFSVDALGAIIMLIISLIGSLASVYSVFYLREETAKHIVGFRRVKQYFALLNIFLLSMFLAVITVNPIIMWISIEATTLSTVFLISFYNKPLSIEAAWKYLIVNSVGLLLGFFGTLLFLIGPSSGIPGSDLVSWRTLLDNAGRSSPVIAEIAFIFILIGYGTKMGLVPMHTWLPDAHSKAPAPISALLSGVLLNVAFLAILRFKNIVDVIAGGSYARNLLIMFGLLSIVIAASIMYTQKNYKRLLAYSSIENMGIMALGFGFGGLGAFAAILHMMYHSLVKSSFFLLSGNVFLKYGTTKIAEVKGAMSAIPFTSVIFLAGFLAITGVPPFGIFLTKMYILSAGIKASPIIAVIALISFSIIFIGFLKHATVMMFGDKPAGMTVGETNTWLVVPPLILMTLVLYLSCHVPRFIADLIHSAVVHY